MNAKQTKLIEQAATVDVDGEGWRKRMDRWLDDVPTVQNEFVRTCIGGPHTRRTQAIRNLLMKRRLDVAILRSALSA